MNILRPHEVQFGFNEGNLKRLEQKDANWHRKRTSFPTRFQLVFSSLFWNLGGRFF